MRLVISALNIYVMMVNTFSVILTILTLHIDPDCHEKFNFVDFKVLHHLGL